MNTFNFSRVLCISAILFMFVTGGHTAISIVTDTEDPDHKGLCHYKGELTSEETQIQMFLKPGEIKKHPKECLQISCEANFDIGILGCGIAKGTDECPFVVGKKTDPYPECCGKIVCRGDLKIAAIKII